MLRFARHHLVAGVVGGAKVLEVGSYDVNGTVRPEVEALRPVEYVGVDMRHGPGVDMVVPAADLVATFGTAGFDVVVCAEVLEHVEDWRSAIEAMKAVLMPGGVILLTTRSVGFPLHDYPADHWRFSVDDLVRAFADFAVLAAEPDPQAPGAFIFARKLHGARSPANLGAIAPGSMHAVRGNDPV